MVLEAWLGGREAVRAFGATEAYGGGKDAVMMFGGAGADEWVETLVIEGGDEKGDWGV